MGENIHFEKNVADGVAVIRLDRPKVNALSSDMMRDLHAICDELAVDDTTRAVVVTGGRKNFAAGADISEFPSFTAETAQQFSNMFKAANAKSGITGEILLQLCERRLDNIVYRLGIAPTRRGARQLVSHRHITVNGSVVNIPSYRLREGDVVGVREKSKSLEVVTASLSNNNQKHDWLSWDTQAMSGTMINIPSRDQIPENIKESLIVELYSK